MKAPGRIFLLIAGIVYTFIVAPAFALISFVLYFTGVPGAFYGIIFSVAFLAAGIIGIRYRNNFAKAEILMTIGILGIVVGIIFISSIGTLTNTGILLMAPPICYMVGAYKNYKVMNT